MRVADHEIDSLFTHRWSPRAMSGAPLTLEELYRLFEAARWAPSSGNNQPWRFAYAIAGTPHFSAFYDVLEEGNKTWCKRAGALLIVASRTVSDTGRRARTHSYDTGAAWSNLAHQGTIMKLVVHGMEGFDYERAAAVIRLPKDHQVEAMIAVGHPGKVEELPERYRERETPNNRKPISSFIVEGAFPESSEPPKAGA